MCSTWAARLQGCVGIAGCFDPGLLLTTPCPVAAREMLSGDLGPSSLGHLLWAWSGREGKPLPSVGSESL